MHSDASHGPHLPCLSLVRLHQLPGVLCLGPGLLQLGGAGVVPADVPAVGGGAAELSGEARCTAVKRLAALGRVSGPHSPKQVCPSEKTEATQRGEGLALGGSPEKLLLHADFIQKAFLATHARQFYTDHQSSFPFDS